MRVAFLRGINVGGHQVRKEVLCEVFAGLGLHDVRTFIASGNVLFDLARRSKRPDAVVDADLELRIAAALELRLGWAVPTFVRSPAEVAAVAGTAVSVLPEPGTGETLQVGFWHRPIDGDAAGRVEALATPTDLLRADGRELYWLSRGPVHKSKVTNVRLERAGGGPVTFRNLTTLRRLVDLAGAA